LARELLANNPKFILLNSGSAEGGGKVGFDLNRLDTNALLRDAGILAAAEDAPTEPKKSSAVPVTKENPISVPSQLPSVDAVIKGSEATSERKN